MYACLLQINILCTYSYFSSNIMLLKDFFWVKDLSAYDIMVVALLGDTFNHISLFTLTAVITSFLIYL